MKKIVVLLSVFFIVLCRGRENNFAEKRKGEILLFYLVNKKNKKKICLEVMQSSQNCLQESSNIPTEAKESDKITEKSLSKYISGPKGLEFKKGVENYSEFCETYSEEFLKNTSDQLQACNFSCDKDFWEKKQDDDQCKIPFLFEELVKEGFTVKGTETKKCIQNCFSYINTKISRDSLKDLKTYDFFELIRKR